MCDSKNMFEILTTNKKTENQIINDKIHFINQLTNHRNLKIKYQIIDQKENLAIEDNSDGVETSASSNSRGFV